MLTNRLLLTQENKDTLRESLQGELVQLHRSAPNHYTDASHVLLDDHDACFQQRGVVSRDTLVESLNRGILLFHSQHGSE